MPATLTTPIVGFFNGASATATQLKMPDGGVSLNPENGNVALQAFFVDASGVALGSAPVVTMTHTAFLAAVQAASGLPKNRLYTVYSAQASLPISAVT